MTASGQAAAPRPADEAFADEPIGESRWPPALALVLFIALNIAIRVWLPSESAVRLPWLVPGVEGVLLVALFAGNPAHLARRSPWPRRIVRPLSARRT